MMIVEAVGSYLNNSKCVTGSVIKQRESDPSCHLLFLMQIRSCCLSRELRGLKWDRGGDIILRAKRAALLSSAEASVSLNTYDRRNCK